MSLKIVSLMAENVKKLKAVLIKPEGSVVKITGANEQGKTTVLDCIFWALAGSRNIQKQPIRTGEKKARIVIDLDKFVVTRKFTESGSTVEVTNKDGAIYKSPQAMLDGLIGSLSFDPLKFSREQDKQVEMLLKVVKIDHDHDKLKLIAGVPIVKMESPIDDINNAYKTVFAERTNVNRDVDRVKKILSSYETVGKADRVVTTELITERDRLQQINLDNDKKREALVAMTNDAARADHDIEAIETSIKDLELKLAQHKAALSKMVEARKALSESIESKTTEINSLVDSDLTDINSKIATADTTNLNAEKWEAKQKLIAEFKQYEEKADRFTAALEKIKSYKDELISKTEFPVPGLGFSSAGVTLNDIPFEQCSSAQRLRASVGIAMAMNPELRVIRIDDGSLLDKNSMSIIEEMAKDKDYQVWIEVVGEDNKVGIYIEDGEIKTESEAGQTELKL